MGTLLARFENDHLRLDFAAIPKPLPVILYLRRPVGDQPEALAWIKEWVAQHGQAGAARLLEILSPLARSRYEELSELLWEWEIEEELSLERQRALKRRTRKRLKP